MGNGSHSNQGKVVRVEAWIVRRLVYAFSRLAKRGHRPREANIRSLMERASIPVPPPSRFLLDLFQNSNRLHQHLHTHIYSIPSICTWSPCTRPIPGDSLEDQAGGESEPQADDDGQDLSDCEELCETEIEEDDPIIEVKD